MPRSVVQSLRLCTMEPLITRMQRYDTASRVPPTAKLVKNAATSKRSNTGDGVTVKQARLHSRRIDKLVQAKLRGESRRCASQYVVERSSHGRDSRVLFWFGSYDAVIWSLPGRRLCSIRLDWKCSMQRWADPPQQERCNKAGARQPSTRRDCVDGDGVGGSARQR